MNNLTKVVLVIAIVATVSGFIYLQIEIENLTPKSSVTTPTPSLTASPSPSPYLPPANVTANISLTPIRNFNNNSYPEGDYLLINGNVTNNSPNIAYNVGLHVGASAVVISSFQTVIDVTVPIQSGTYNTNTNYNLTTLNPHQTITIAMTIYPNYQSEEPDLSHASATPVWSNMP